MSGNRRYVRLRWISRVDCLSHDAMSQYGQTVPQGCVRVHYSPRGGEPIKFDCVGKDMEILKDILADHSAAWLSSISSVASLQT
jgi:hypothetical protein